MNNTIRTFKAATMKEALAQVRREMGLDAIVVGTRQVAARGLFSWLSSRQEVEVKASRPLSSCRAGSQRHASASISRGIEPTTRRTVAAKAIGATQRLTVSIPEVEASVTIEKSTPQQQPARQDDLAPPPSLLPGEPTTRDRLAKKNITSIASLRPSSSLAAESPGDGHSSATPQGRILEAITTPIAAAIPTTSSEIEQRLDTLQQMIAELGRRTRPRGLVEIPPELFAHYLTLIEADIEDELARELIAKLQQHAGPGQLEDTASASALLAALIEREIRCAEPLAPRSGCQQIAMLIGPTGVGKTTTLAKLAGQFGVRGDLKVGLITIDTYRVAAVDQLRTYAEIIDLPMQVVHEPGELSTALAALADRDLVLIDTAGRSPHDDQRLNELKQLVDAAAPDHIFLVLSSASGAKALQAAAQRFALARPTSLILTKLDEAVGCGALLSASRGIALPVAYVTTGQEVPRDIEPANPCRAARLILGRERLLSPRPMSSWGEG